MDSNLPLNSRFVICLEAWEYDDVDRMHYIFLNSMKLVLEVMRSDGPNKLVRFKTNFFGPSNQLLYNNDELFIRISQPIQSWKEDKGDLCDD